MRWRSPFPFSRVTNLRWIAIAGLFHGALLFAVLRTSMREHVPREVEPSRTETEVELTFENPSIPSPAATDSIATRIRPSAKEREPSPLAPSEIPNTPQAENNAPGPQKAEPPGASQSWSWAKPNREALGLGGQNVFLGNDDGTNGDGERTANAQRKADERNVESSIGNALRDHDRSVGLDASGPVLSAAREIIRASATPTNSKVTFRIIADRAGLVTSVEVVGSSEANRFWNKAANDIKNSLANTPLRVPPRARGLALLVEVESREVLPSGRAPGVEVRILGLGKGDVDGGAKKTQVTILDPKLGTCEFQFPGQDKTVRVPCAQLGLFGLNADPVDIAATAKRLVQTKLLREDILWDTP